ncbi:MAG: hypothetical protein PW734_10800 [Verrucomicrobium sp.]|nr:hypothetical protein [Verrucomicrobium sp.]
MFRLFVFCLLVFGLYVLLYGTPPVASIDASLPPALREIMANLHNSALTSIGQAFAQGRVALGQLGDAIASSLRH